MLYPWEPALGAKGIAFNRRGMTVSGPPTIGGRTQVSQQDAGYWIATLDRMPVAGPEKVKAFRRLMGLLEGGAHQVLVPVFDKANAPWPTPGVTEAVSTGFTDGTRFTDGTGFYRRLIDVRLAADAALRTTHITITASNAAEIVGGEMFSFRVGRLHVITRVLLVTGSDYRVSIWPPLRKALTAGARLDFDNPKCLMRLAAEGADDLSLEMGRYGFPSVNFIEVVDVENDAAESADMSCLETQRTITTAGDVTLGGDCEDVIIIKKSSGAATQVTMPAVGSRIGRKRITVVDGKYDALTNNITLVPAAGETIMGGSSYIIDSNGASIGLRPLADGSGWF